MRHRHSTAGDALLLAEPPMFRTSRVKRWGLCVSVSFLSSKKPPVFDPSGSTPWAWASPHHFFPTEIKLQHANARGRHTRATLYYARVPLPELYLGNSLGSVGDKGLQQVEFRDECWLCWPVLPFPITSSSRSKKPFCIHSNSPASQALLAQEI